MAAVAEAQSAAPRALIHTCVLNGKKLTSDRLIPECSAVAQRVLNSDGSLNRTIQPTPTEEERGAIEAREREASAERVARSDALRRDRNLMQRYPDEAAHRAAREKALDDIRNSVRNSRARIDLLRAERKPLLDEAEFYAGKPLPSKVKLGLDANDASLEAQKSLIQNQETEVKRINDLFDADLARLKKLWAGAPAGSLGSAAPPAPPPPARLPQSGKLRPTSDSAR